MSDHLNRYLLSFDVGGSHATAGLIRAHSLELSAAASDRLHSQAPARDVLRSLEALGKRALGDHPVSDLLGIAMAMPGPFDYKEGISYIQNLTKYDNLYGVNLRSEMASRFSVVPKAVRFVNDAQAALLGEVHCGVAVGVARAMELTLGTGVGSAFAVDGQIVTSGPGVPADGYVYCMPWNGGTVEDAVAARALQRKYRALTGEVCEVHDIATRARAGGDAAALSVWQDLGRTLGMILKLLASGFRPDLIVLGGAISQSSQLFLPVTETALQGEGVSLRVSALLDRPALFGAAVAWLRA